MCVDLVDLIEDVSVPRQPLLTKVRVTQRLAMPQGAAARGRYQIEEVIVR